MLAVILLYQIPDDDITFTISFVLCIEHKRPLPHTVFLRYSHTLDLIFTISVVLCIVQK